jgi:hypothetical protein
MSRPGAPGPAVLPFLPPEDERRGAARRAAGSSSAGAPRTPSPCPALAILDAAPRFDCVLPCDAAPAPCFPTAVCLAFSCNTHMDGGRREGRAQWKGGAPGSARGVRGQGSAAASGGRAARAGAGDKAWVGAGPTANAAGRSRRGMAAGAGAGGRGVQAGRAAGVRLAEGGAMGLPNGMGGGRGRQQALPQSGACHTEGVG